MMKGKRCLSCKKVLANKPGSVEFVCPACGEYEIVRCQPCRQIAAKYTCPKCEFEGPN